MRRIAAFAVAALAVALLPMSASSAQGDTGAVTIVHAATYSADEELPVTLCVSQDGEELLRDPDFQLGETIGPIDLPAGTYDVVIYLGIDVGCDEPGAAIVGEVPVEAGGDITVAATWGSNGPGLTEWTNFSDCLEADESRVTVRHAAATGGPVDILAGTDPILEDFAEGEQASLVLPAGITVEDISIVGEFENSPLEVGDLGPLAASTQYVVYAVGGDDGPVGVFVDVLAANPCPIPIETTTTVAPTTTVPAMPVAPVAAAPRFTG